MCNCKYSERCWRRAYSEAWLKNKRWIREVPTRFDLIISGYARGEMAQTYKTKKGILRHKGIYADKIPDQKGQGICPATVMQSTDLCTIYREEEKKRKRNNNGSKRVEVGRDVKRWVARRDKFYCYYCHRHITELKALGIKGNIDHIVPVVKGGSNSESNLAYTCFTCNNSKGSDIWQKGCMVGRYNT